MARCIQCTRCVRFGQEIAGVMELGMIGRGEHSEIVAFVGHGVDSELSGNMIDICPVGALTSKPFRYAARTWELARRRAVSPHDSLGSNLIVQAKGDRVLRVVPFDNPAVNECWISDKDRFSYEALASGERLTSPMVKDGGEWKSADWPTALEFVARGLKGVADRHGGAALGTLISPHATLEEMALAARLTRALGSDNVDFRLRQSDFRGDGQGAGIPWLGMPIADLDALERVLVVGSFLRKDHPLVAQRLRQARRKGAEISLLHSVADDSRIGLAHSFVAVPSLLPHALAEIVVAAAQGAGKPVPSALAGIEPVAAAVVIAASLLSGERKAILLGNFAEQHAEASQLLALAQALSDIVGARLGCLTEAANSVGGHVAGALPHSGAGLNAGAMLADARRAYLVLGAEAEFDCANPVAARSALEQAEFVVVMSPFRHGTQYADVLLPISPFTETAGTFVNCEGRAQAWNGVVKPLGETRPAWKVLRVLGSLLGLPGFDFDSIEDVRASLPSAAEIAAQTGQRHAGRHHQADGRAVADGARRRCPDSFRGPAGAPRAVAAADRRREAAAGTAQRAVPRPAGRGGGRAGPDSARPRRGDPDRRCGRGRAHGRRADRRRASVHLRARGPVGTRDRGARVTWTRSTHSSPPRRRCSDRRGPSSGRW